MMLITSLFAALILSGYLLAMRTWCGQADMVSDTYYQLRRACGQGWPFSVVLLASALMMMVCMLSSGQGLQCMAFVGTAGLAFVALAPNYLSQDEKAVHKGGALVAALGCTVWSLTVSPWPTITIAALYAAYLIIYSVAKAMDGVWWIAPCAKGWHPWYWAEVACFANTFITYWLCQVKILL